MIQDQHKKRRRPAFTIVELLVVIGIMGILTGMVIPAVQAARESARRTTCKNQVRQLALAVLLHEEAQGHFPTGGWDWSWLGDPDRGFGPDQPGGWFYNSLPYLEENDLHQLGVGMDYPEERQAHAERIEMPVTGTLCPSRRNTQLYPFLGPPMNPDVINAGPYEFTTRIDYAINAGSSDDVECERQYLASGGDFVMPQRGVRWCKDTSKFDGITYQQSLVLPAHVADGLSKTYLLGEKYLNAAEYESGIDPGDNESPYTGVNVDHTRGTSARIRLIPDTPGVASKFAFGSAHESGFHMATCDGAVDWVTFDVDPQLHQSRGSRNDGAAN
jgi:prepilin-type N-terminal cleavage/methylation domain-containing protein